MRGIRGKKVRMVKEGTLIATVDIGMTTNTGYCTTIDGRDIKPFTFENSREGFEKFWHIIVASKNRFGCTEVMVGYESTGPYAEPLAQYLMDKPVTMVQVNPLHTKRLKEVNDNSPRKTDDKDPRVIADVLRLGHALSVVVPEGDAAYLRRLNNARERHVGERTALLNQIQQLVFLIFPEFKKVFNDVTVKTARHILKNYTTPERIGTLNKDALGEEIRKRSWGKFGVQQAELLINLARDTVGIKEGVAGIVLDIRHILMQLEAANAFIEEIAAEMAKVLERIPSSTRILSMKGLGVVTVAGLIGEVGDFSKFRTQSEIMKLAGLDLYEISSGKRKGQKRISKRGRSLLRKILYSAAVATIRKNGIMCDYYARLIGRGMVRTSALIVIAKKLLRIIHAMLRDDRDYIPNYESPERVVIKKAA
ncbi:MAG TPA: IS110 family transposase [Syntrophorhabdales bacterium]|nr:IS110 family transposase [Syntrophorhabdales bacterium]